MAETTSLPALLPCPFCGGAARLVESKAAPDGLERHSVECGPNSDNGSCPVEPSTEWRPTVDDAVVLWNTRAAAISPESPEGLTAGERVCEGECGGRGLLHLGEVVAAPATQGDVRVRACAGCQPQYGDCLNAGCFLMLGTLGGGDVVEMGDAQPGCGPLWTSPDAPLSRRVELILSRLLSDVIEPRDAIAEIVRLAAPRAAVTDAQRVENGRARRWTCPEEAAIRQLVADALSLSVDDVTEDVSEMLHRLVYQREMPSRVLASVEGEMRVFRGRDHGENCPCVLCARWGQDKPFGARIHVHDPVVGAHGSSRHDAGAWLHAEAHKLFHDGAIAEGSPVRVMIVADDPWTRESAASFAGVLDPESLDNTAPPSPMASECDRWGCDGDHKYFSHDPQTGELTPWKEA